jgi:hypothetical protein
MMKPKFNLNSYDKSLIDLIDQVTHQRTGVWALMCAKRVLPFYIDLYPQDQRPKIALETLQTWINTGEFRMDVIRKAALDSHAAAREVGEDNPARSAARAAAQAVSTAHVRKHAIAASSYALQAVYRAAEDSEAERSISEEREWQKRTLLDLMDQISAFE